MFIENCYDFINNKNNNNYNNMYLLILIMTVKILQH